MGAAVKVARIAFGACHNQHLVHKWLLQLLQDVPRPGSELAYALRQDTQSKGFRTTATSFQTAAAMYFAPYVDA